MMQAQTKLRRHFWWLLTVVAIAVIILVVFLVGIRYQKPGASLNTDTNPSAATINLDQPLASFTTRWGCFTRQGDNLAISIENTLSDAERSQGLVGRPYLPSRYGMLFTFADLGWHGMWMKNMLIALDFVTLDQNLRVTNALQNVQPCSADAACQVFTVGPGKHIIELAAGEVYRSRIQAGQQFTWSPGAKCR